MSRLVMELALERGQVPQRVPVLPKIWLDAAAAISRVDLVNLMADGRKAMGAIVEVCDRLGVDGARLFPFPDRRIRVTDGVAVEYDTMDRRLGVVDLAGGLGIPARPAEALDWSDPATLHALAWRPTRLADDESFPFERVAYPDASWYRRHYGSAVAALISRYGQRISCIGDLDSPTLSFYARFRGVEMTLIDLLDNPSRVQAAIELGIRWSVERGRFFLDAGCRILRLNDSMANMSMISPTLWRTFIKPAFTQICESLHSHRRDALIYCHVCGDITDVLPDLVDCGLDGIGPLDTLAGMNVETVRRRVGDMTLLGGVNPLSLVSGPVELIDAECRSVMDQARASEGNFVLGSGCAISRLTPISHLHAMRDAGRKYPCTARSAKASN